MKAIVRFFRQRAVSGFVKHKKSCVLPDISKCLSVAVILDNEQFENHKEIENTLKRLFEPKRYTFIVCVDELPKDVVQTDRYFFIGKDDFNFWGLMKSGKKESLLGLAFDLVMDFSKKSDGLLTNAYVLTLINNSFRMTFGSSCPAIYDMVIDSKNNDDILNRIQISQQYLSMLLGKR